MGKITIEESDVIFGPFHEADLFHIEKSETLKKLGTNIKTVEFVVVRKDNKALLFVEEKNLVLIQFIVMIVGKESKNMRNTSLI